MYHEVPKDEVANGEANEEEDVWTNENENDDNSDDDPRKSKQVV